MKVVYPICCGVDVHKTSLVATITLQGLLPTIQKRDSLPLTMSILQFKQWLNENNCFDLCMESTGKYWVPNIVFYSGRDAPDTS